MRTQLVVADYLKARGWPHATPAGSGRAGVDVLNTPDIAVEVKARREFNPGAYLRQAEGVADGRHPFAVLRLDGQGDTDPGQYVVLTRLEEHVRLLHAAGYGDPTTKETP